MKRFWTVLSGMCLFLGLCVVPSFAASMYDSIIPFASTNPSYPSGSSYGYFVGSSPSGSPNSSASDYFVAVTASLTNGFRMVSRGLYDMQQSFAQYDNAFDRFSDRLVGTWTGFTHFSGNTTTTHTSSGALYAINQNLFYGLKEISSRVKDTGSDISTLDAHIQSGFSTLDSHLVAFNTAFSSVFPTRKYYYVARSGGKLSMGTAESLGSALSGSLVNGFLQLDADFARIYDLLYDPQDEALKDESADQKDEFLDNFFGDGGNGVKPGQIGALGGISSGAGSLLDTGADMGSVFDSIGDPGSSVWSWFSTGNSDAINGSPRGASEVAPYSQRDDIEATPSPEVVDFYGAQREEFLSMLGGG